MNFQHNAASSEKRRDTRQRNASQKPGTRDGKRVTSRVKRRNITQCQYNGRIMAAQARRGAPFKREPRSRFCASWFHASSARIHERSSPNYETQPTAVRVAVRRNSAAQLTSALRTRRRETETQAAVPGTKASTARHAPRQREASPAHRITKRSKVGMGLPLQRSYARQWRSAASAEGLVEAQRRARCGVRGMPRREGR